MKTTRILLAACLAASFTTAYGDQVTELRDAVARLEKSIASLADRVTALEGKATAKPQPPAGPDEAAAQRVFAEQVRQQSEGAIEVVSFKKTDGLSRASSGVDYYDLSFDGEIRFNFSGIWRFMPALEEDYNFVFKQPPLKMNSMDKMLFHGTNPGVQVERGARLRLHGQLYFKKTERGWQLTRMRKTAVEQLR